MQQGKFRPGIEKKISGNVVRYWNKLPRELVESPALEVLKRHLDEALGDMVWE